MKPYLIFLALTMAGCTEEIIVINELCEPTPDCVAVPAPIYHPGQMLYGRVTGLKNCSPFVASAEAYIGHIGTEPYVSVVMNTYEDWGGFFANKEEISLVAYTNETVIGSWPLIIDTFPNVHYQAYSTVQDHDVFEDLFRIDNDYKYNHIRVSKIDTLAPNIRGELEARFIIDSSLPSGRNPDTVLFSNCYFEAWHP